MPSDPPIFFIGVVSALLLILGFCLVVFPAAAQKVALRIGGWGFPGGRNPFLPTMRTTGYRWYLRSMGVVLILMALFVDYGIVVGQR